MRLGEDGLNEWPRHLHGEYVAAYRRRYATAARRLRYIEAAWLSRTVDEGERRYIRRVTAKSLFRLAADKGRPREQVAQLFREATALCAGKPHDDRAVAEEYAAFCYGSGRREEAVGVLEALLSRLGEMAVGRPELRRWVEEVGELAGRMREGTW